MSNYDDEFVLNEGRYMYNHKSRMWRLRPLSQVEKEEGDDFCRSDFSSLSMMRKVRSLDFFRQEEEEPSCLASKFSQRTASSSTCRQQQQQQQRRSDCDSDSDSSEARQGGIMARLAPLSKGLFSTFLLLSFCNFALEIVHAQMHQLDSPHLYLYDALSPEVISPPFSYKTKSGNGAMHPPKGRLGLGSAAISSVTEALSPILPFTGGIDLRREELWDKGWFSSLPPIVDQVRDAFGLQTALTINRGGAAAASTAAATARGPETKTKGSPKNYKKNHQMPISDSKPFYPLSKIADLTLGDLTTFFQYATSQKYVLNDRTKPALAALETAVQTSRGRDVLPSLPQEDTVDALVFCAAMRIFAEWRMVRQVPDGYKGYAVGMNLGHKDIVQNLGKMETAVHKWLDYRREQVAMERAWERNSGDGDYYDDELRSPTLRDLLEHEVDCNVHARLPRLVEKTAAMGLLWVRRQLHYQTSIFSNILRVPETFPNSHAAVASAYAQVYGQYHGWAVQKIFNYSFQAAPAVSEIYKFMNPHRLRTVQEEAQRVAAVWNSPQAGDYYVMAQKEDYANNNPWEKFGNRLGQEWTKFGRHVGGEWDKLVDNVVRVFDQDSSDARVIRGGATTAAAQQVKMVEEGDAYDQFITEKMQQDAHEHIVVYLESVMPLLNQLADLFQDLNMDDPTKV